MRQVLLAAMQQIPVIYRCAAIALILTALTACASLPRGAGSNAATLSSDAKVLDLPFETQDSPNLCGLVVVDMFTGCYHERLSATAHDSLKSTAIANKGLSGDELVASLRRAGYEAVVYPGTLDHRSTGIFSEIDQGKRAVVMLKNQENSLKHFVNDML